MKHLRLLLCIIPVLIFETLAQNYTGSLPHIPVIVISRFNPENERGKEVFEKLKSLGADALLIPDGSWNPKSFSAGKASIINITPSDSSNAFDVTRYVDAAYSIWEAEGTPLSGTDLRLTLNNNIGIAIPDSGYVRSKGVIPGVMLRGPGYRQKMIYDSYGEPNRSQMVYSAAFFVKFTKESWVNLDSADAVGEFQIAVRYKKYTDSLYVLDQRPLTYGDILRADTDGWFAVHLLYHLDALIDDEYRMFDPSGAELSGLIEFPVIWNGITGSTLYVDKVVVSEPRGFSLAHDPMVREYFVDTFLDHQNAHLLEKWFAMPRPLYADSQFPYRTIDSLANLAVTLRDRKIKKETTITGPSILYLSMRNDESGSRIEPVLYPELRIPIPPLNSERTSTSRANQFIRSVHTGLLYGATQLWIDTGLLSEDSTRPGASDVTFSDTSEPIILMQQIIIPRLKGEFGRTMKYLKDPVISSDKKLERGAWAQLDAGAAVLSRKESNLDIGVYRRDAAGGSSYIYAISHNKCMNEEADSLVFSINRNDEPYQNYLIRNIITGESETVLKDQSGEVRFVSSVPAGDARLFEIVPAVTRKGSRSLKYDETITHDFLISNGDTLYIYDGVTLTLQNGASIRNNGTMIVQGSQDGVNIDFVRHSGNNGIYNNGTLQIDRCKISNGLYGIVHQGEELRIANTVISACGTGLILLGSGISPKIVELHTCVLSHNGFGLFVVNSILSLTEVECSTNGTGITVLENSILVANNTIQQTSFDNAVTDLSVSRSLIHFEKSIASSGSKPVLQVEENSLFIGGESAPDENKRPLSMVLRAMQLAISGDTTEAVRICNEVWGEFPDTKLAAIGLLVVRYIASKKSLQQFPVFIGVLAGSSYPSPLRFTADLINRSTSYSEIISLENRYTEPHFRETILSILFLYAVFDSGGVINAKDILRSIEDEFPDSHLTWIARSFHNLLDRR